MSYSPFKMKGFSIHKGVSPLKSHPSPERTRLEKDVKTFQKQYDDDTNEKTKKDLDWARQALEEYMSEADGPHPK